MALHTKGPQRISTPVCSLSDYRNSVSQSLRFCSYSPTLPSSPSAVYHMWSGKWKSSREQTQWPVWHPHCSAPGMAMCFVTASLATSLSGDISCPFPQMLTHYFSPLLPASLFYIAFSIQLMECWGWSELGFILKGEWNFIILYPKSQLYICLFLLGLGGNRVGRGMGMDLFLFYFAFIKQVKQMNKNVRRALGLLSFFLFSLFFWRGRRVLLSVIRKVERSWNTAKKGNRQPGCKAQLVVMKEPTPESAGIKEGVTWE